MTELQRFTPPGHKPDDPTTGSYGSGFFRLGNGYAPPGRIWSAFGFQGDPHITGATQKLQGVEWGIAPNHSRVVSALAPTAMEAGKSYAVEVVLENAGHTVWTAKSAYLLGSQYPQDNHTWGIGRVALAPGDSILPGQRKSFRFDVTAPAAPGVYDMGWRMVQEDFEWFGAYTPKVSVTVSPPGSAAAGGGAAPVLHQPVTSEAPAPASAGTVVEPSRVPARQAAPTEIRASFLGGTGVAPSSGGGSLIAPASFAPRSIQPQGVSPTNPF